MTVTSQQTRTITTAAAASTANSTAGTAAAEDRAARTLEQAAAVAEQRQARQAHAGNYPGIETDNFFDANVNAVRCIKGGIVEMVRAAAELRQIRQTVDAEFYDFARCRLGLTSGMADFLLHVAEMGVDPARFSPVVEVKMTAVMETMARIVAAWAAVNSGAAYMASGTANVTTTTPTAVNRATAVAGQEGDQSNKESRPRPPRPRRPRDGRRGRDGQWPSITPAIPAPRHFQYGRQHIEESFDEYRIP